MTQRPAALPADREDFFERAGGRLRYAVWNAPASGAGGPPRGTVVLVHGRAEFIEKYAMETVGDLRQRGFAVYALDTRGQGLSSRMLPDHDKGHIDDFSTYVADLRHFLETVVLPTAPKPLLLFSHSTGGNIALRYLAAEGSRLFAGAAFSSPMTALPQARLIRMVLAILNPFRFLDTHYAPGTGPWNPAQRSFATNDVTHDERRYRFTDDWFAADPRLRLGGPTIGWLRQAFRSFSVLDAPACLERIDLPVLVVSGGEDTVVNTLVHKAVAHRIPGAEHVTIEGARHELLMETDARRAQFWAAFDRLAARACPADK
ncbi:MAG: alpha/beta hydrolase [Proteobacteria bacterium]|nr:alpha/beta hydrolase [Pseudomonadota bacterium]